MIKAVALGDCTYFIMHLDAEFVLDIDTIRDIKMGISFLSNYSFPHDQRP